MDWGSIIIAILGSGLFTALLNFWFDKQRQVKEIEKDKVMSQKKTYHQILFDSTKSSEQKNTLERAWRARDFEIQLYWQRTLYFWGFITLSFFAYENADGVEKLLSIIAGLTFSFLWFYVNKASKFWQENWECHIDCLESEIEGNLYKTVLKKTNSQYHPLAATPFSVSKINQCASLLVVMIWIVLAYKHTDLPELTPPKSLEFWIMGVILFCLIFILPFVIKTSFTKKSAAVFETIDGCDYTYHSRITKKD